MRGGLVLIFACCLVGVMQPARADSHSVSYSVWTLSGQRITLKYMLPTAEAERLVGPAMRLVTIDKLRNYLLQHTGVTAGGKACLALDQGWDLGQVDPVIVGAGLYGFEIFFRCDQATDIELENTAMFDVAPDHVNFATIETAGRIVNQMFTSAHTQITVSNARAVPNAGFAQYFRLGVRHMLHSAGALCLLLGLFLLTRRPRGAALIVGGLVAGGLLSSLEAVSGVLVARPALLDAFTAFLVVLVATELVARKIDRERVVPYAMAVMLLLSLAALFSSGAWPATVMGGAALLAGGFIGASRAFPQWSDRSAPAVAVVLGFLEGFVLPAQLAPLQLGGKTVAAMNVGFNLGIVIVAAVFLGFLVLVTGLVIPRFKRFLPSISVSQDLLATGLGGVGAFWLVSRIFV